MNGGYVIVDMKGLDAVSAGDTEIPGIYDEVRRAYYSGKALMLSNLRNMSPMYVSAHDTAEGNIVLGTRITVEPDDNVIVVN